MTSTAPTSERFKLWAADMADRVVRTGAQVFAAYLTVVMQAGGPAFDLGAALTQVGFAIVLSLLTSLISIPSFGEVWAFQLAERGIKTFVQNMIAGIGTATIFAEVDWAMVVQASWLAALYSVMTSVATTRAGNAVGQINFNGPKRVPAAPANQPTGSSGF